MNAHSRTLTLPGAAWPMREHGTSALDRVVTSWPAPDPAARVLDSWGAPTGLPVVRAGVAPWAPPDVVMRFDLPRPGTYGASTPVDGSPRRTDLVEPQHDVSMPDVASVSLAALDAPPAADRGFAPPGVEVGSVQPSHVQVRSQHPILEQPWTGRPMFGQPLPGQSLPGQSLPVQPWPAPTPATARSFDAPQPVAILDGPDRNGITLRLIVGLAAAAGAIAAGATALISLF